MKLNVDIIHINGLLHKMDVLEDLSVLWWNSHEGGCFCVLVTTNVANLCVDKSTIAIQMRFNWPRNLLTYFQEQGYGSQQKGTHFIFNLLSYVSPVLQLIPGMAGTIACTDSTVDGASAAK
jgi:hypothetical protein